MPFNRLVDEMLNAVVLAEIIWDDDGTPTDFRYIRVNRAMAAAMHLKPSDFAGRTSSEILPGVEPEWLEIFGDVVRTGRAARFERYLGPVKRHFAVRVFRPAPEQFAAVFTDITEQREAAESLRLAHATLNAVSDAVYWLDETGHFVFVNDAACAATLYSREELLKMTVHDLNPNFPKAAWPKHWEQIKKRRTFGTESFHRRKDGVLYPVSVHAAMVEHEGKAYNCAVARDITALRENEAERQKSALFEATAVLAGGIAHDFNNLMTAVIGNAELLEDRVDGDEATRKMVENIIRAAERAGRLAQQMLAYAGSGRFNMVRLNLNAVVSECLKAGEWAFSRRIRLEPDLRPDLWQVHADTEQMREIIVNLLTNAMEAVQSIGCVKVVTQNIDADETYAGIHPGLDPGRYALLRVQDDGVGMDGDLVKKIFEPFFTTKFPGRGLGLSAVHGIVHSHGGKILVESKPGRGTVFDIYLPAAAVEEAPAPVPRAVEAPVKGGGETILLVEDEFTVQGIIEKFLTKAGYRVLCADDGRSAVRLAEAFEGEIHGILLDLEMPVMTGEEAFPLLRRARPNAPVVLISSHTLDVTVKKLLNEGAAAFVQKPYQLQRLGAALRGALQKQDPKAGGG